MISGNRILRCEVSLGTIGHNPFVCELKDLEAKRGIAWLSELGSAGFPAFRCGWIQGSPCSFLSSLFSLGLASGVNHSLTRILIGST